MSEMFSSRASSSRSVLAWLSMTRNSLLASMVWAVWDWSRSSTFWVRPVHQAPYFRTRFQRVNRKLALYLSKTMAESYYQDHQGTKDKASNTTN